MRVIQVGLGGFGRSWAVIARDAQGIELVTVVDPLPAAWKWASDELGLGPENCYGSLQEALTCTDSDAVLVVTPPETHYAVVTAALKAGKHVLVEKPLATTLPDAHALIDTASQAGRILMVSQNYRFRRPVRAVQRLVAEGILGGLQAVKVGCHRDTRALWPPDNFRYHMQHPYALDMAIHHFDLLRAITGQNVRRIYSRSWRVPDSPYRHDPAMVAVMVLDDGATVTYEGSWASSGPETSWNGEWELVGEEGRLLLTGGRADMTTGDVILEQWGQPPQPVVQMPLEDIDRAGALQAFRSAVETGQQPETRAEDNINSLAVVFACVQSIESDQIVNVTH